MSTRTKRVFFQTEEVVRKTKIGYMDVSTDFVQMYHTAWKFIIQLSGLCSRDFILWVISKTNEHNQFNYCTTLYKEFISDMKKAGAPGSYAENTVHVALKELVEKGILTRVSRGVYMVNPGIFWSGPIAERAKIIKAVMETVELSHSTKGNTIEIDESPAKVIDYGSAPLPARSIFADDNTTFSQESFVE